MLVINLRRVWAKAAWASFTGAPHLPENPHAIKVILPDLVGNDPKLVTRFRQEALAAAAIRHQNIIARHRLWRGARHDAVSS